VLMRSTEYWLLRCVLESVLLSRFQPDAHADARSLAGLYRGLCQGTDVGMDRTRRPAPCFPLADEQLVYCSSEGGITSIAASYATAAPWRVY
jgi:hypothetical protein